MSKRYQVLARKYRPRLFREVIGQDSAVTTLKNAIRFHKIAHAYLFCGSRGVGKTTLARLFAKALNCEALGSDFEPCETCSSCQEISSGQSFDVIEIDGASHRGIDDVRKINETVAYAPSKGRFKVYIIDEVHMLTKEAFNALLKTLEEPPEKVKFFFATTEPHKVLPTILSRCQRFDLTAIKSPLIIQKLSQICRDLSRDFEEEALDLIASFSEGSLRDAESLLDQILCFCEEKISADSVRQALGLAPKELFQALDEAFFSSKLEFAFELTEKLFEAGKDLSHFFDQLIQHYRNLLLTLCKNPSKEKLYTKEQALYILDVLIQQESSFQKSVFQRISLEAILLKIIRSKHRIPVEKIVRHLTENVKTAPMKEESPPPPKIEEAPQPSLVLKEVPFTPTPLLCRNDLKNRGLDKEISPNGCSESATLAPGQGARESKISETKSMQSPTDSSSCSGIKPPEDPVEAPTEEEKTPLKASESFALASKPKSHYDTIVRFTAVELEGTVRS